MMDEPIFYRGTLEYPHGNEFEVVEFYYPANVEWVCTGCGDCCGDVDKRERMIRLLPEDIKRIMETGAEDFYEEWDEGRFTGLMCKKEDGKCVFYTGEKCSIYDNRALICKMYPFWLEIQNDFFLFGIDLDCLGTGKGEPLDEDFFAKFLMMALKAMEY